jgi:hypothetical protein
LGNGPLLDANRLYSLAEVAAILATTESQVQQLWENWDAQIDPRLEYTRQAERNPPQGSSGAHLREYLKASGNAP